MYTYNCKILRWLDGDTLDLLVDVGFEISVKKRVRVYGLNTPETHSASSVEKDRGLAAKRFAMQMLPEGSQVKVQSHKAAQDNEKFGRWLADMTLADGRDFAQAMIDAGHGVAYFGGKRTHGG